MIVTQVTCTYYSKCFNNKMAGQIQNRVKHFILFSFHPLFYVIKRDKYGRFTITKLAEKWRLVVTV